MGEVGTLTPMEAHASSPPGKKSYKYAWSRYVARRALEKDLANLKARVAAIPDEQKRILTPELVINDDARIRDVVDQTKYWTGPGVIAPEPGKFKVGIVGAGVAGLFSAMLFDWLNDMVPGLNIDYDILEAAKPERLGGRLYTHYFSETTDRQKENGWVNHDYYDVGAMRYPDNDVMQRTFKLFTLLGMNKLEPGQKEKVGDLIRYYMQDGENEGDLGVCPAYFNNVRTVGRIFDAPLSVEHPHPPCDPYNLNSGLPERNKIPKDLLSKDPSKLVKQALNPMLVIVKSTIDEQTKAKEQNREHHNLSFWNSLMMKIDHMSTRQYLALDHVPKEWECFLECFHEEHCNDDGYEKWEPPNYNYNTIEWLETATYGTGWYDQALSETVLEELDFYTDDDPTRWWCISGGTQYVPRAMAKKIAEKNKKIQFNSQVIAINANVTDHMEKQKKKEHAPVTITIEKSYPGTHQPSETRKENYLAVFNSTTLAAMQRMDLQNAGLLWGTKQAIRALGYGASCKVAIKFRTPWWQLKPYCINMGSLAHTDLPLRVCVYPSYNIEELEGHERWYNDGIYNGSVLLCSYTWGQDAQRIGSLISRDDPKNWQEGEEKDKQLKSLLLRNLALLHATDCSDESYKALLDKLEHEYVCHHAWDWHRDENMSGAFAYFGPSQFSETWQEIIKPNAFGQLFLVGEAASSHHAWIVGALESVVRAAYLLFEGLQSGAPEFAPYRQAMQLLSTGTFDGQAKDKAGKESPFWPLPAEMPRRQEGVKRKAPQTDLPKEAVARDLPLTHPAAVASLSRVECFYEIGVPMAWKPTAVA